MSIEHPLPLKVQKLIEDLNSSFWEQWSEATNQFPDTTESSTMAFITLQSAIISIVTNYIIGFSLESRTLYLEELIKCLRHMEVKLRDVE